MQPELVGGGEQRHRRARAAAGRRARPAAQGAQKQQQEEKQQPRLGTNKAADTIFGRHAQLPGLLCADVVAKRRISAVAVQASAVAEDLATLQPGAGQVRPIARREGQGGS